MSDQERPANRPKAQPSPANYGAFRGGFRSGDRFANPAVKPKKVRETLVRLWKFFGRERKLLTFVLFIVLLDTGIGLSIPFLLGKAIDSMSGLPANVSFGILGFLCLTLLAAYVTDTGLTILQGWTMAGVSQRIVMNLRKTLFARLQKLPISFFDTRSHGDLMSRLTNDIDNVSTTIGQSTSQLMANLLMIAGSLTFMLILSPLLTLASIITVPLVFLLTRSIAKRTRVLFKDQQTVLGRLNGHIEESISGIQVVKAFSHEEETIAQFEESNGRLCQVGIKAQIWAGLLMPLMNVINNIGFAAVAGVGGILAVNNLITIGLIASFISYSRQFGRPLNEIANIFNMLQTAVAGAERVFEIIDEQEEPADPPHAVCLENPRGNVVFENVSFGYSKERYILENISFQSKEGSSTALVGPTGAGKTTVVNLLARFYDIDSGRILIDGRDIRDYTRDSLRKCFGIVLQDTYLFSGTISENLKYGRLEATDGEMQAAAAVTSADVFINRLHDGYETLLSESGTNLSQGQRQLLAITRAILAAPSILILDEATSSVDTRTELHIQKAMLHLMEGRTSFIIAHRLSTIKGADKIMVIDKGSIVEAGSHAELVAEPGIYHDMYYSQFTKTEEE